MPTKDKMKREFGDKISPVYFKKKAKDYFEDRSVEAMMKWTLPGFLLYCDVSKRQWEEFKTDPKYKDTCDKVMLNLEDKYCHGLETKNPTGSIFALKNMGWSDEKGIKSTIEVGARLEDVLKGIKVKA